MGRVDGKVAFVTGAARGQGRSHAVRLAEEGADIIMVDLCRQLDVPYDLPTSADLEETVAAIEALDRRVVAAEGDVRDLSRLHEVVDSGTSALGPIDIVAANAGIVSYATIAEMTEATWGEMIDINLTGVWNTVKAALPHLADGSAIVITSSTAGLKGFPTTGHYVAAKHGVVGLMRTLAQELGPRGIRVNTINPTQVNTRMIRNQGLYQLFRPDLEDPDVEDFEEASAATMLIPVPWVEPIDVSEALLFLAAESGRYITGVCLPIDAGALSR